MADSLFGESALEVYKCNANEALQFKLLRSLSDEADDQSCPPFHPAMTHQVFGEAESIFGYMGLQVRLLYSACQLHPFVKLEYAHKVTESEGVQADDIVAIIGERLGTRLWVERGLWEGEVAGTEALFEPFGSIVHSFQLPGSSGDFETYHVKTACSAFVSWHQRLQTLLLFFVDAASFIDTDDPKWHFFIVYERCHLKKDGNNDHSNNSNNNHSNSSNNNHSNSNDNNHNKNNHSNSSNNNHSNSSNNNHSNSRGGKHAVVAYMSVYDYYAYPDKIRPRVSQVLVMPELQGKGHGLKLLQTFYKWAHSDPRVLDIAVEDASEDFQRLRDLADCTNSLQLLSEPLTEKSVVLLRQKLKLSKKQAQRVYEILKLRRSEASDDSLKRFKVAVKKRLNAPLQKNSRHYERLSSSLKSHEMSAFTSHHSTQQRILHLETHYQELLEQYRHVIKKMEGCGVV